MADNNALHSHPFVSCEESSDEKDNDAKHNIQAKILDYYRPHHSGSAPLSQPAVENTNSVSNNDNVDNSCITRMLEDVCKELDSIDIIVTKPHNNVVEVVECLRQLNGDSGGGSSKSVVTPNGGQVVLSSAGNSNSTVTISSDLTALQRRKLSAFRDTLDPLEDEGLTHSAASLNTNEQHSLSTSAVEDNDLDDEEDEEFADHGSNSEVDTTNTNILSNSSFNVTDSVETLENSVDLQQMHCISIDVVTEAEEDSPEQSNYHKSSAAACVPDNMPQAGILDKKPPTKKHAVSYGTHKSAEHRNAKARRISQKMKLSWAKELQATGRLVCPMQGCYQTYVTVANFQTHYKWCTGKKNLQHCPYCESLIFAGQEAVLHHMQVEHPDKVSEYKETCAVADANQSVQQTSSPVNASKPFGKRISKKYYKMKNLKNHDFASKENILCQKKPLLNHGLKSIEKTMDQNFKEFKKCVRFNDIVQKINSVSDEPTECSEKINATKIRAKPFGQKKGIFLEENSEVCYFSDESDSVDCPGPVDENQEKTPRKVSTKSRIVLNTQGYERFNQYLKLTRDWASERRTYSRNRSSDSSITTTQSEMLPIDIQDTYQLNDSFELSGISLSVNEPVNSMYAPLSYDNPDAIKTSIKKMDKHIPLNHQAKFKKSVNENEMLLKNIKGENDSNSQKSVKSSSVQNSGTTDPSELNYGHLVFSKPNKVVSKTRAHTTCYDNAGSLGTTSNRELCQENTYSKNQETSDCPPLPPPPPVIDFDTLLQSTVSVSEEKQSKKRSIPEDGPLETGTKMHGSIMSSSSSEDKLKYNKASKYRKQDGVKLPKSTHSESKTKKRVHSKKDESDVNPVMYNEALKTCFNEDVNDVGSTLHASTKEAHPGRTSEIMHGAEKSVELDFSFVNEKSKGIIPLKKLAFVVVNGLFIRTCNSLSETDISSFLQDINKGSIFNPYAVHNHRGRENIVDSTCQSLLQNLIDQISSKFNSSSVSGNALPNLSVFHGTEHIEETPILYEQRNNGFESKRISTVSALWKAYLLSFDIMHSKYIYNVFSPGFESYLVKPFPTFSLQKKRGRPPKKERVMHAQYFELKRVVFENSVLNHQNGPIVSSSVISQVGNSSLCGKVTENPHFVLSSADSSMNASALNLPECKQKRRGRPRKEVKAMNRSCPTVGEDNAVPKLDASAASELDTSAVSSKLDTSAVSSKLDTSAASSKLDTSAAASKLDISAADSKLDTSAADSKLDTSAAASELDISAISKLDTSATSELDTPAVSKLNTSAISESDTSAIQNANDEGTDKGKNTDVTSFATSTPVTRKRKRGRPPKNISAASNKMEVCLNATQNSNNFTENSSYSVTAPTEKSEVLDTMTAVAGDSKMMEIENQSVLLDDSSGKVDGSSLMCSADVSVNVNSNNASTEKPPLLQAVRKSTRLRKRKIDPDTVFLHPKKISRTSSVNKETTSPAQPDLPTKKGKRGRPKKKSESVFLLDSPNYVHEIENRGKNSLSDPNASFTVPTIGSVKTNRSSSNSNLNGQKVQSTARRKGRPRKCSRYADLNSGIDSPESSEDLSVDRMANRLDKAVEKEVDESSSLINLEEEREKDKPLNNADSCVLPEKTAEQADADAVPVDETVEKEDTADLVPPVKSLEGKHTNEPQLKKKKFFKTKRKLKLTALKQQHLNSMSRINASYRHTKEKMGLVPLASKTKVIKAKGLSTHKKHLRRISSDSHTNMQKNLDSPAETFGRKTRSAALKARKMFGQLNRRLSAQDVSDELTKDDDFIPPSKIFESKNVMEELSNYESYYFTPSVETRSASATQIDEWVKELELNGKIICGQSGCEKVLGTKAGMIYHYEHACLKQEWKWHCKICKKALRPSPEIMLTHFKKKHRNIIKPEVSRVVADPKPKKLTVVFEFQDKSSLSDAELFPEFKPKQSFWKHISCCKKLEEFIPFKKSVNIKLGDPWFSLAPFESYKKNINTSQATFFVGGPVLASCWCPTPSGKKSKQYIFVATSSKMLKYHHAFSIEDGKSLLQVWDCGHLHEENVVSVHPTLKIAVTLECGKVWCIASCPRGCWEDSSSPNENNIETGCLPRLGVVAAACSDGLIRVYSFPHPESLNHSSEQLPFYDVQPVAVLEPVFGEPSLLSSKAMCTALSWQKADNCELISAGYSNGLVSLWKLTSVSGLLTKKLDYGVIISPYQTLPAHSTCVTCIDFSPLPGGRYFATGGSDKTLKVWDLYQPEVPLLEMKKALAGGVQWPAIFSGPFVCFEEGIIPKSATCFQDLNIFTKRRNVLLHTHSSLGQVCFSVSEFLNMAALGGTTGEVVALPFSGLNTEQFKGVSQQYPIFQTEVKSLPSEKTEAVNLSQSLNSCESNDCCQVEEADNNFSYDAVSSRCGLTFTDILLNGFTEKSSTKSKSEDVQNTDDNNDDVHMPVSESECELASISTVCWNPNKGSHCWLFTANKSGVARLLCASDLESQRT